MKAIGLGILISSSAVYCNSEESLEVRTVENNKVFEIGSPVAPKALSFKKYVSVDLAAIPSQFGVFNFGIRKSVGKNEIDVGLNAGKGKYRVQLKGYCSWLCYLNPEETNRLYGGIGLSTGLNRGRHSWTTQPYHTKQYAYAESYLTQGLFSVGANFFLRGFEQFFQANLLWPMLSRYDAKEWSCDYLVSGKGWSMNYNAVAFSLNFGIYF